MSESPMSSQEVLFSSQQFREDVNNDCSDNLVISTQEVINTKVSTQEAVSATDFLDNLRDSQVDRLTVCVSSGTDELDGCEGRAEEDVKANVEDLDSRISSDFDIKPLLMGEKKKRGRKRKIRTAEEMEVHLKDKKEKNRLAAQRLRQRKCSEIAKYDKEVEDYEKQVQVKRNFCQHLEAKVEQLRNRIKARVGANSDSTSNSSETNETNCKLINTFDTNNDHNYQTVEHWMKVEPNESPNHFACISR